MCVCMCLGEGVYEGVLGYVCFRVGGGWGRG